MFKKILAHKFISLVVIITIIAGGYYGYTKIQSNEDGEVSYRTEPVQKGNITVSVTGTGQVSVLNQVDIKPEASGRLFYLGVQNDQEIKTGTLIAQIDASDALSSVRDAEANLESAKLSLEKLLQPADSLSILQAENDFKQAIEAKENAEDDLVKAYEDGFNEVADTFLELPSIMAGLQDILHGSTFKSTQSNHDYYTDSIESDEPKVVQYEEDALSGYITARDAYDANLITYKNTNRSSDVEKIEELIDKTYNTARDIAEAVKDTRNLIDLYVDVFTQKGLTVSSGVSNHQNTLDTYTGTTNSSLSALLAIQSTIDSSKEDIINGERNINEKTESLAELKADPDPLDIQSQELTIRQRENSLLDAQQKLADYSIRAPFDGVIAELSVQKGESVSSGTVLAKLITTQKIAEITLNEIDVAQVSIGQKAILEFDAVEDLSITGEVAEIDTLGTVTQGVVSYDVKIGFDVQDERIKPGMSLSVNIIIESKRDVIAVPISAVKTGVNSSYVEVLDNNEPQRKTVITGISSDTIIEIVEGLTEGEQIITQTINNNSGSQSQNPINQAQRMLKEA